MIPRIVPDFAVGRTWIRLEKIKKKTDTAANMMPRSRYMLSELTLAERIFTMPQITMVGNRTGSITPHWIESLYFKVIYTVRKYQAAMCMAFKSTRMPSSRHISLLLTKNKRHVNAGYDDS